MADAQAKGIVEPSIPPAEVLSIVTAMSMTWSPPAPCTRPTRTNPRPRTTGVARHSR
ncbi:hypothetical protein NKH18_24080 [Streptomyces sp. M10(2022)]